MKVVRFYTLSPSLWQLVFLNFVFTEIPLLSPAMFFFNETIRTFFLVAQKFTQSRFEQTDSFHFHTWVTALTLVTNLSTLHLVHLWMNLGCAPNRTSKHYAVGSIMTKMDAVCKIGSHIPFGLNLPNKSYFLNNKNKTLCSISLSYL